MKKPWCDLGNMRHGIMSCRDVTTHLGYRHAESWEEALAAFESGKQVYDVDGDRVTALWIISNSFPPETGMYQYNNRPLNINRDDARYMLIPEEPLEPEVTDEDVQAAIDSIKRSLP